MKKLLAAASNWGWLLALAAVALFAFAYFVARPPVEDAIDTSPSIPEELADHQTRGDMERGRSVGATPNTSIPRAPGAVFQSSPNWSGRGTCGIEGIVVHVTGPGSMAGMASWFKNPASQVSAHFGVGKQGELHQYVEVGDSAWHAGILNRPDLTNPLVSNWVATGANPNRCTVGIELLLGGPAEPLSDYPAMQATLGQLLRWLRDSTGVPLDRAHVIGHYQIDAINRSTDPVCCVNIDSVLRDLGAPAADVYCCEAPYGGRYNITKSRWEWRPDDLWIWTDVNPTWVCQEGCP